MPAAIAPALISGASSIIGSQQAAGAAANAEANAARQRAAAQRALDDVALPSMEQERLNLETLQYLGNLTPEQMQLIQAGPTAMEQINIDPQLRQQQLETLERVGQLSREGMTPEEKTILEMSRRKAASETQAKMGQILQDRQQRGIAGGGDELAAKLAATQQGADMQSQQDMQAAQQMMATRRAALEQLSNMSGNLRKQDYGEQSDLARARDVINQFNTQNAQDVERMNVGARNLAAERNLKTRQDIANSNTELRNSEQEYNKKLLDQDFKRRLAKATGQAGYLQGEAGASLRQGEQAAGRSLADARAIGSTATAIGNIYQGKKDKEEQDFNAELKKSGLA